MEFEKTSIELYGILIQEPVTALTDLIVSVVCFYAFVKLKPTYSGANLLRYYFLLMALTTVYGGIIGHAFIHHLSFAWKLPGWLLSMVSVALLERTSIKRAQPLLSKNIGRFFSVLNIVELLTLILIVCLTLNFSFVEGHAAYGLLVVVFSFEAFIFKSTRAASSKLFMIAVGISALAATVHLTEFSIDKWFNHLDLSHVLMATAAFVFFLGGKNAETLTRISISDLTTNGLSKFKPTKHIKKDDVL